MLSLAKIPDLQKTRVIYWWSARGEPETSVGSCDWLCHNAYKIKLYLKSVKNSFKPRNCPAVYQRRANPLWTWCETMMIPGCSLTAVTLHTLTLTWHHLWFTSRWPRPNLLMSLTPTLVQQICWAVQVSFSNLNCLHTCSNAKYTPDNKKEKQPIQLITPERRTFTSHSWVCGRALVLVYK